MIETTLPRAPDLWAMVPAPDSAPLLELLATLRQENAALRAENAALHERIRELEARLGQTSANSSRPPHQIRPRYQRGQKPRPPDGSGAGSPATAGRSVGCCRPNR